MSRIVKAISLWEPHASLMRTGAKTIETRGWYTHYRGELLICAAQAGISRSELIYCLCCNPFQGGLAPLVGKPLGYQFAGVDIKDLNQGKAVALVDLYDCKPTGELTLNEFKHEERFGNYTLGRFAWKTKLISNSFDPFPVTGGRRFFYIEMPDE